MRLIDADALIADLEHDIAIDEDILNYVGTAGIEKTNTQFDKDCKQNAIDLLLRQPNIDAVEVVRGEWKEREVLEDTVINEWQSARCSVCGKYHTTPYMYYFDEYNFCPHCGAKMKGADDE